MRFLNTILLVLILAALCTAGGLLYFGKLTLPVTTQASAAPEPPPPSPIFVSVGKFNVTVKDEENQPQLFYIEISVRVANDATRVVLNEHMPEVRNRILTELSRLSIKQLQPTDSRITLAENLRKITAAPYSPQTIPLEIISVLFTDFIVQQA
jgi:flagellar FliL protein